MRPVGALDFEATLLGALGLESSGVPWTRWSRAYATLSDALTRDRDETLSSRASGNLGDEDTRAVAALVFGGRTFRVARAVLEAYPPPPGPVAELGAGCGPFGLAAALTGQEVSLWDLSSDSLELAGRLFRAAGLPAPGLVVGSAGALSEGPFAAIALPYSLNEMVANAGGVSAPVDVWMGRWMERLLPGGRLYVIEPGTKAQSLEVQRLRESWREHVLAPCPQNEGPCPMLEQPRDWCHFTWSHTPGSVTERLGQLTGRDLRSLRFSWLVLGKEPAPNRRDAWARVLELRRPDRHKLSLTACGGDGQLRRLTALKRDQASYEHLAGLEPGALVEVESSQLEAKGDGLRVRSPDAVRRARDL